jgi:hypothetical protein
MDRTEYSAIKRQQYFKNEYRPILLCIDAYEEKTLIGRLYHPYFKSARYFNNVMQLLLIVENLFDKMDFPQPFEAIRTFWKHPLTDEIGCQTEETEISTPPQGKLANFQLKVIFRQNASWQGSLTWLEQNKEESFRSVLELLLLLNEALTSDVKAKVD